MALYIVKFATPRPSETGRLRRVLMEYCADNGSEAYLHRDGPLWLLETEHPIDLKLKKLRLTPAVRLKSLSDILSYVDIGNKRFAARTSKCPHELAPRIGGVILDKYPDAKVDLSNPEVLVEVYCGDELYYLVVEH